MHRCWECSEVWKGCCVPEGDNSLTEPKSLSREEFHANMLVEAEEQSPIRTPSHSELGRRPKELVGDAKKAQLKSMLRSFAMRVAEGPGIEVYVEADSTIAAEGSASSSKDQQSAAIGGSFTANLRMDRRLSRLECWPKDKAASTSSHSSSTAAGSSSLSTITVVPLGSLVAMRRLGIRPASAVTSISVQEDPQERTLTLEQLGGHELHIQFRTVPECIEALMCLKVFQLAATGRPFASDETLSLATPSSAITTAASTGPQQGFAENLLRG
mmetsp:Transcript_26739/g.49086  ORF Transcript_26739/g.49086 Transcript_26739/m.49086 type:complete len:271 (-) Transcript_26739:59-871(-)